MIHDKPKTVHLGRRACLVLSREQVLLCETESVERQLPDRLPFLLRRLSTGRVRLRSGHQVLQILDSWQMKPFLGLELVL